jgi:4-amino-4-deoxy-L-arabinose transferase-like glycosyltransferase
MLNNVQIKQTGHPNQIAYTITVLGVFVFYITLRLVTWSNVSILEDHGSIGLMREAKLFLSLDWQSIIALKPESNLFYPFFVAIFSTITGSVEVGARLCSLFFSSILFFSIYAIGRRFEEPYAVVIGLILLATNAVLVRLSYSILTEPSYIALVYVGYWIFLTQYKKPRYNLAILLGIVYGLSFLDRFEGILYLAAIPALQFLHFIIFRPKQYDWKRLAVWSTIFVLPFLIIIAPQVWRVSSKMDSFHLNGRQGWSIILNAPDGHSYNRKIGGLDYSPSQVNLHYLLEHPFELQKLANMLSSSLSTKVKVYAKLAARNFQELYTKQLGILIGPLGMVLFAFGLLSLFQTGYRYEAGFVLAIISIGLVGPLLHNVVMRHIAVIAPIMFLLEGMGIIYVARALTDGVRSRIITKWSLAVALTILMVGLSSYGILQHNLSPNTDKYSHWRSDYEKPLQIVREIQKQLGRPAVVSARKSYFSYYADGVHTQLPYTDSEGLMQFYRLNDPPDFVFLEYRYIRDYPFLDDFSQRIPDELELLYRGTDKRDSKIELYRYRGKNTSR